MSTFTLSYLITGDEESTQVQFDTLEEAMDTFNDYRRSIDADEGIDYVSIALGAWGDLITYDTINGITLFQDIDEDVVSYILQYANANG